MFLIFGSSLHLLFRLGEIHSGETKLIMYPPSSFALIDQVSVESVSSDLIARVKIVKIQGEACSGGVKVIIYYLTQATNYLVN